MQHSQIERRSPAADSEVPRLPAADRRLMLRIAATSIVSSLAPPLADGPDVDPRQYSIALQQPRGTFVTLHHRGRLRGCCGSITASEPMIVNLARSARAAAFFDERFSRVCEMEIDGLELHISIIGILRPLAAKCEEELLDSLRVGQDGLVLRTSDRIAVFLPAVWKRLPEPREFVARLKVKAGLAANAWPSPVSWHRFNVQECAGRCVDCLTTE